MCFFACSSRLSGPSGPGPPLRGALGTPRRRARVGSGGLGAVIAAGGFGTQAAWPNSQLVSVAVQWKINGSFLRRAATEAKNDHTMLVQRSWQKWTLFWEAARQGVRCYS